MATRISLTLLLVSAFLAACAAPAPTPVVIEREVTRLVTAAPPTPTAPPTKTATPVATATPAPPTPEPTPEPTATPTQPAGTALPGMDVVYDRLTAEAQRLVDARPALFDQRELASERYRGALNLVAQTCNSRCRSEMADAIAERTEAGGALFYTAENRMIVDQTTGVNIPLLVATRVKAIADGKTVLDPMKPGWTLAIPGGYNKGVAEQITEDPAKIEALYQDLAFPMSWWFLEAPNEKHPYLMISEEMVLAGSNLFDDTIRAQKGAFLYHNFMSMAQDASGAQMYGRIITDGKLFDNMVFWLTDATRFAPDEFYRLRYDSYRSLGDGDLSRGEKNEWNWIVPKIVAPGSKSSTNYDRLILVTLGAVRTFADEEELRTEWNNAVFGGTWYLDVARSIMLLTADARLAQIGVPSGGISSTTLTSDSTGKAPLPPGTNIGILGHAPVFSDALEEALSAKATELTGLPLQKTNSGAFSVEVFPQSWQQEIGFQVTRMFVYENCRTYATGCVSRNGVSRVDIYRLE